MSPAPALGRLLRTVRHLRAAQAWAQLRHASLPGPRVARVRNVPARVVDAVRVPFLPPGRHAGLSADEHTTTVRLLNRVVAFRDAIDWGHADEGPLWAYHLHQFDHLRAPEVPPALRSATILDWIAVHRDGIGWDPHPTAHRVLSWSKLLLTPGALGGLDPSGLAPIHASLASQIETLSRNLEWRLQANHLFSDLLSVVFGGLLFEGREPDRWLARLPAFLAELRDQVLPDGAHEERSPLYHALLLEQLLDLLNLARVSPRTPAGLTDALVEKASRMCGALEVLTLPDGEIALFADTALGVAPTPPVLTDYASALHVPVLAPEQPDRLPFGGYVRLADARLHLVASLSGPAPAHQPGHAHCDALSFELCVDGERAVSDTGVYEYRPGPRRDAARATRSHATVEVDGQEQAEWWAGHRVGGRPRVQVVDHAPGLACEATCEGWSTRGTLHRRRFELEDGVLRVHDALEGEPRPVRLHLPLAPGASARLVGDARAPDALQVRLAGGGRLDVELPGRGSLHWRLELRDCFPEFGRQERRWCLVGEGERFVAGSWRFQPA